jgi:hypothetical protein
MPKKCDENDMKPELIMTPHPQKKTGECSMMKYTEFPITILAFIIHNSF